MMTFLVNLTCLVEKVSIHIKGIKKIYFNCNNAFENFKLSRSKFTNQADH